MKRIPAALFLAAVFICQVVVGVAFFALLGFAVAGKRIAQRVCLL